MYVSIVLKEWAFVDGIKPIPSFSEAKFITAESEMLDDDVYQVRMILTMPTGEEDDTVRVVLEAIVCEEFMYGLESEDTRQRKEVLDTLFWECLIDDRISTSMEKRGIKRESSRIIPPVYAGIM